MRWAALVFFVTDTFRTCLARLSMSDPVQDFYWQDFYWLDFYWKDF